MVRRVRIAPSGHAQRFVVAETFGLQKAKKVLPLPADRYGKKARQSDLAIKYVLRMYRGNLGVPAEVCRVECDEMGNVVGQH